jgi:hypothetical protein
MVSGIYIIKNPTFNFCKDASGPAGLKKNFQEKKKNSK